MKDFMLYFKNLLKIYVIPYTVLGFLFSFAFFILNLTGTFTNMSSLTTANIGILVLMGIIYLIYIVLLVILTSLYTCSIFRIINLKDNKRNLDFKTLFRDAKRFILPNLGLGIIQLFIFMGLFTLFAIPNFLLYQLVAVKLWAILSIFFSILFLIVIYMIIMNYWSFAGVGLIYDDKKVFQSLKSSTILVRGNFWPVLGKTLLMGLIVGGIASALTLPLMVTSLFLGWIPVVGSTIQMAMQSLISATIAPLGAIFMTRLYLGMKENKFGKIR